MFQFHIGSIQAGRALGHQEHPAQVSIPHWFDSSIIDDEDAERVSRQFQFHIGSIQALAAELALPDYTCFNSTLVRFKLGTVRSHPSVQ